MGLYYTNRSKWDKLPIEKRIDEINAIIDEDIKRWNEIKENGCSDPFWSDGVNMNLKRNHIIHDISVLQELERKPVQLSLFTNFGSSDNIDMMSDPRIPPLVPDDYMAKERKCFYFERRQANV